MKIYEFELVPFLVREEPVETAVTSPDAVVSYMSGAFDKRPDQEQFWILFLNRKNKIAGRFMLTLGTQTACLAHPREILRAVILANAAGFVCVHNHPSGDPAPSSPDVHVTRIIHEAAKAVDAMFVDHVIIGDRNSDPLHKGYYSFREAGLL